MPANRTPAQQAASRANGARSRGPTTEAGKARSARNGTKHGLRGGPFALLPDEDHEELVALHAAVTSDWGPRDAYEHRWVIELVTAMWRQDHLRGLELATLTTAAAESPPSEAAVRKLATFARYGARIGHWPRAASSAGPAQPPRCADRRAGGQHARTRDSGAPRAELHKQFVAAHV